MAMRASAQSARKSLMAKIPFKSASSVDFNKGSAYRAAMLAALLNGDHVLQGASAKLRADRDIAMTAVQHHASSLQYASVALRADREVVLAAVRKGGYALQYASPRPRFLRERRLQDPLDPCRLRTMSHA